MVLSDNGHHVTLWTRNEDQCKQINDKRSNERYLKDAIFSDRITATTDLKAAIADKEVVVIAIASQAIRSVLEQTEACIQDSQIVVNVSKGIEIGISTSYFNDKS
jgi:glycerol-3-phosphate dehydrogenase (NAD(P)+)